MVKLRIIHYRINRTKSLLRADRPFRVAVLADLHNSALADEGGLLREHIRRLSPDAVFCCGDMMTAKYGKTHTKRAVSLLQDLVGSFPVYAVNGNHETRVLSAPEVYSAEDREYFRELSRMGVRMLNNASTHIRLGGTEVFLAGFEADMDLYRRTGRRMPDAGQMRSRLGDPPEDLYTILLSHNPDCFEACSEWGADLVLSGHLHGGMVRLPLLGGVVGTTLLPFPKYGRGKYRTEKGCEMVVSAGLGAHTIPLRFNNPPELVILE